MKVVKKTVSGKGDKAPDAVRFAVAEVKGAGSMMIAVTDEGLCWTGMTDSVARLKKDFPASVLIRDESVKKLGADIAAVWQGRKKALPVPVVLYGTAFQMKVWSELLKIPRGKTLTYQDIARKIGKPLASRAVGTAVGRNPVTLLVPCHRVLASAPGAQLKFGWGPAAKKKLLTAEGLKV